MSIIMMMGQIGKGINMYYCHFYESCGSPTKDCAEQTIEIVYPFDQHIYYSKIVGVTPKIKILCSNEWIYADHVCPMKNHVSKGYHVQGIRQWSVGAGHNTTCPACLVRLAQRRLKTDFIFQQKLIDLAAKKGHK